MRLGPDPTTGRLRLAALVIYFALACLGGGLLLAAPTHDETFSKDGLFKAEASALTDTQLVPDPEAPLSPGVNVLWCGTLQLAWNEAEALIGGPIHLQPPSAAAEALDLSEFSRRDLDPDSYVALADFEHNHVEAKIRAALQKTFGGAASPELIPPTPAVSNETDFVAYAYLYKNLAFAQPFQARPFPFAGKPVKGFGFPANGDAAMRNEVKVYDYRSPDDFIISFKTKAAGDDLILAKTAPGATLGDTSRAVLRRMEAGQADVPDASDYLNIPKLNFDLRRDFPELQGPTVPNPAARIKVGLFIKQVRQLVRFQLNEKGAILKSEAVMVVTGAAMPEARRPLVFDKPFLILLKRTDSARPYFALWVGNPTLFVPADKSAGADESD